MTMSFLGSMVKNEKVVIINAKAVILSKTSGLLLFPDQWK